MQTLVTATKNIPRGGLQQPQKKRALQRVYRNLNRSIVFCHDERQEDRCLSLIIAVRR